MFEHCKKKDCLDRRQDTNVLIKYNRIVIQKHCPWKILDRLGLGLGSGRSPIERFVMIRRRICLPNLKKVTRQPLVMAQV
jgi:hypothetical protein